MVVILSGFRTLSSPSSSSRARRAAPRLGPQLATCIVGSLVLSVSVAAMPWADSLLAVLPFLVLVAIGNGLARPAYVSYLSSIASKAHVSQVVRSFRAAFVIGCLLWGASAVGRVAFRRRVLIGGVSRMRSVGSRFIVRSVPRPSGDSGGKGTSRARERPRADATVSRVEPRALDARAASAAAASRRRSQSSTSRSTRR
jgi:hypothetical protein